MQEFVQLTHRLPGCLTTNVKKYDPDFNPGKHPGKRKDFRCRFTETDLSPGWLPGFRQERFPETAPVRPANWLRPMIRGRQAIAALLTGYAYRYVRRSYPDAFKGANHSRPAYDSQETV
jgi:hypothetical protein